ncbi:hypothetical protein UFOVP322_23 [uncultured Caudovirales phage]|uniref:Uncharacterized protein n=1 Tax=uncultured Caudovirales phage TaxID=2100421 RepID=A0A6J5NUX6_9CAUD|nr:hypothetical protein UFOVP322_23 [uncultured Caudovirales phage]CAB4160845.1 hypothetical protein UFOVP771_21 [uncultured Caudovirales phage]CAB4166275.1 hypothetical protein UFOVP850_21 [uncultured Caudovirales phage]
MNEIHDSGTVSLKPSRKQLTEGTILGYPIGRDKKIVPPDEVQKLAALGCSNRDIANFFGIEESNVSRHFAAFITKGREELKITLRRAMLDNACRNMNAAVQIFLAKNILGMSDTPVNSDEKQPLPWSDE